jgi:hypothetical protein
LPNLRNIARNITGSTFLRPFGITGGAVSFIAPIALGQHTGSTAA